MASPARERKATHQAIFIPFIRGMFVGVLCCDRTQIAKSAGCRQFQTADEVQITSRRPGRKEPPDRLLHEQPPPENGMLDLGIWTKRLALLWACSVGLVSQADQSNVEDSVGTTLKTVQTGPGMLEMAGRKVVEDEKV